MDYLDLFEQLEKNYSDFLDFMKSQEIVLVPLDMIRIKKELKALCISFPFELFESVTCSGTADGEVVFYLSRGGKVFGQLVMTLEESVEYCIAFTEPSLYTTLVFNDLDNIIISIKDKINNEQ